MAAIKEKYGFCRKLFSILIEIYVVYIRARNFQLFNSHLHKIKITYTYSPEQIAIIELAKWTEENKLDSVFKNNGIYFLMMDISFGFEIIILNI